MLRPHTQVNTRSKSYSQILDLVEKSLRMSQTNQF
jgi:hypothetical protein